MRRAWIYALCEPDTTDIRYIGKTVNVGRRYSAHMTRSSKEKTHLGAWLRKVISEGKRPMTLVLKTVLASEASAVEIEFIRRARRNGIDLVNGTDGGDGVSPGSKRTHESRRKQSVTMRGHPISAQTREKISAAQRGSRSKQFGKPRSSEVRAAISAGMRGRVVSQETRQKISRAHFGIRPSQATRKKMSKAKQGSRHPNFGKHLSRVTRKKISTGIKNFHQIKVVEKTTNH